MPAASTAAPTVVGAGTATGVPFTVIGGRRTGACAGAPATDDAEADGLGAGAPMGRATDGTAAGLLSARSTTTTTAVALVPRVATANAIAVPNGRRDLTRAPLMSPPVPVMLLVLPVNTDGNQSVVRRVRNIDRRSHPRDAAQ